MSVFFGNVFVTVLLALIPTAAVGTRADCSATFRSNEAINSSVVYARGLLHELGGDALVTSAPDRVAVMILFSQGFGSHLNDRLRLLRCSLRKLQLNMPNTPKDVYVWVPPETVAQSPEWMTENARTFAMGIHPASWQFPCGLEHDSKWTARRNFNLEYYKMGRWRLAFSMDFVKEMGYKYMLQYDDDAMLNGMIDQNLVAEFKSKNFDMGVFSDSIGEVNHIALGLPELTKFWLTLRKFTPVGALLDHVAGHTVQAFSSDSWDRMYHPGYFVFIKVDFWFSEPVQDYLLFVYRSARDIESRWQEQLIQNMIRLVFIPKVRLWVMALIDIGHDRHRKGNFEAWCVKAGINTTV